MTANRNMLKYGITVIELRTVWVLEEFGQIVIQYVADIRGFMKLVQDQS